MKKLGLVLMLLIFNSNSVAAKNKIFSSYYGPDSVKYEYSILKSKKWKNGKSWGFEVTIRVTAHQQNRRPTVGRPVDLIVDCTIPEVGRLSGNAVETLMTGEELKSGYNPDNRVFFDFYWATCNNTLRKSSQNDSYIAPKIINRIVSDFYDESGTRYVTKMMDLSEKWSDRAKWGFVTNGATEVIPRMGSKKPTIKHGSIIIVCSEPHEVGEATADMRNIMPLITNSQLKGMQYTSKDQFYYDMWWAACKDIWKKSELELNDTMESDDEGN